MRTKEDINKDIATLKSNIGSNAQQIIESGLNLIRKGNMYKCPNGNYHKAGDKTPSMSWDPKANQFYCFGCSTKIDIYDYYRDYLNYGHYEILAENNIEFDSDDSINKRRINFITETSKITSITDKCKEYSKSRGITEETLKHFNIKTYKSDIAFEYYKNDVLVGVKTRIPRKPNKGEIKGKSITGSKPFLFNTKNIDYSKNEIIVCEGEYDCMVISQCGYPNVVSIGAGANSLRSLFDNSADFFKHFENIIVVSDNDNAGAVMDNKFTEQFKDKVKLIDKKLYKLNDINEEYHKNKKESVVRIIKSAKLKIEGVRNLEEDPYTGIKDKARRYIPTGIKTIDNAINDLPTGMVTLLTGRTNSGKTTFCTQIKINAIDKGFKVFEVSGEGLQDLMLNKFYQGVIGKESKAFNYIQTNKKMVKEPKPKVLEALQWWHKGKLALFTKGDSKLKTTDQLFNMMISEVKANGHDLIIIDNLMSILSIANSSEKNNMQADFVQKCCDFAIAYNIHIILVLHPNKSSKKGESIEIEHLSGTADMGNKADIILNVIREYDTEEVVNTGISGWIEVSKSRYYSQLPKVTVAFDADKEVFNEISDGNIFGNNIDWKKFLADDVDKNTFNKIEITRTIDECPM